MFRSRRPQRYLTQVFLAAVSLLQVSCLRTQKDLGATLHNGSSEERRRGRDVAALLKVFWTEAKGLGSVAQKQAPQVIPIDVDEVARISSHASIVVYKTTVDYLHWIVKFHIDRNLGPHRNVTLLLKKDPKTPGPDIQAEWGDGDGPAREVTSAIVFSQVIANPSFLETELMKPVHTILEYAAWVSLDPDVKKYLAALRRMAPQEIPPLRTPRNETAMQLVPFADYRGRTLRWEATEGEWYRQPALTHHQSLCQFGRMDTVQMTLRPSRNNPRIGRGTGPWEIELSHSFYPVYLPVPVVRSARFHLENGACVLVDRNGEHQVMPADPSYRSCIQTVLQIATAVPPGATLNNTVRLIRYFMTVLSEVSAP